MSLRCESPQEHVSDRRIRLSTYDATGSPWSQGFCAQAQEYCVAPIWEGPPCLGPS